MRYASTYDLNNATTMLLVDKGDVITKATGFFFAFENSDSIYLVTNKHVFQNSKRVIIPTDGTINYDLRGTIIKTNNNVVGHPSENIDLAIVEVAASKSHTDMEINQCENNKREIKILQESMILKKEELKTMNYCEDVLVIGAPNGICDINNHLLVARKGITATPPSQSYKGNGFLVDVPVSPGASGSPVFWLTNTTMSSFQSTKLLGIISHIHAGKNQEENPIYLHLGSVIPGYSLLEFKPLISNRNHQGKP